MGSCTVRCNASQAAELTLLNPAFDTTSSKHAERDATNARLDSHSAPLGPNQFAHDFSRVPVHAPERTQRIPRDQIMRQGPPGVDFRDLPPMPRPVIPGIFSCNSPFDPAQITTALDTAKLWIGTVVPIVELFKMRRLSADRDTAVRIALRENFNITDPFPRFRLGPQSDLDIIIANLHTIERALNQPLQFHCTFACLPGDIAWVLSSPERFGLPRGIISICPEFFGCDPLKQASTMIHERAHESIGAKDHAYEVSGSYDAMATMTALENADSYAVFVRQVFHNGIHRPGLSCSLINSRIPDFHLTEPTLRRPPPSRGPSLLPPPEEF